MTDSSEAGRVGDAAEVRRIPGSYERRLIAYIDVLGWGSLVERSITNAELMETLAIGANQLSFPAFAAGKSKEFFSEHGGSTDVVLDVTHFSDTIVFSARSDSSAVHGFVASVQLTCAALLHAGHYTRGGITQGLLVHQDNVVFGPALIEAYKIERDVAKYPRVVVHPSALPLVDQEVWDGAELTHFYNVRQDADGLTYVDILGFVAGQKNQPRRCHCGEEKLLDEARARLRSDALDLGRAAKHEWMIRYLESVIGECEPR